MVKVRVIPPAEPMERREHFDPAKGWDGIQVAVVEKPLDDKTRINRNGDAFPVRILDYPDVFRPFTHHRDKAKKIYEEIKRLALMAPPVLTQAMVPEGRSFAMAKTNEEVFRRQVRGETKELKILEPEAPVKECIAMNKGDEAQLMDETGKKVMGQIAYAGGGVFWLKEDPNDIKVGKEMWAVVMRSTDPTVCFGKVRRIETGMEEGYERPHILVQIETEGGHRKWAEGDNVYPTEDAARNKCKLYRSMISLGYDIEKLPRPQYAPPGVYCVQEEK